MIALLLALVAPTLSYQLSASIGVTPVQKVIAMMNEMKAKGTAEMEKEAKLFREYMSWCDVMKDEKETAIREATDKIEKQHAHEMKMHADAEKLGDQVVELDTEIATFSGDKTENKKVRTMEHEDYEHVHEDTTANIDATHQAIAKLSAKSGDISLLQEDSDTLPMTSKELVQSLLEENAVQPRAEVKVFEGSSGVALSLRFRDRISTASQGKEIINVYNCLLTFLYRLGDVSNHFEVCVFSYFSVVSCSFAFLHRFSFMIFSTSLQATFFFYSTGLLLARDIEAGSVLRGCD